MGLPSTVQALLDQELRVLESAPERAFLPARRLAIYAELGPTYASSSYEERIKQIRSGRAVLTRADRIRARIAQLTAQMVAPLWFAAFDEAQLLTSKHIAMGVSYAFRYITFNYGAEHIQEALNAVFDAGPIGIEALRVQLNQLPADALDPKLRSVVEEYVGLGETLITLPPSTNMDIPLNPDLAEVRPSYGMPFVAWPAQALQLTQGVLDHHIPMDVVLGRSDDMCDILGNLLEEDVPAQAHYVGMAFVEALNQTLGIGPFDHQEITATTTDEWLLGRGAAAAPALKAYSGVFDEIYATEEYDLEKRRSFWHWWAEEAIPRAWEQTLDEEEPVAVATMPFEQTVRVTAYYTGITVSFDENPPDLLL